MGRQWRRAALIAAISCAFAPLGCAGADHLPDVTGNAPAPSATSPAGAPCTDGDVQDCSITLGLHGGVLDCYEGTQVCTNARWGACTDGTEVQHKAISGAHSQSLGPASACTTNPCDPFCWNYANEAPPGGLQTQPDGSMYNWTTGSLSSLPPGLEKKGFQEPCMTASDCQFDFHCTDAATSSTCAHAKCVVGSALSSTCDACVTSVCSVDPQCCADTTCSHDFCQTGAKLAANCDPCVQSVCSVRPSCCSGTWDSACVDLVATTCSAGSCACPSGSFAVNNECYQSLSTSQSWTNARTACQAIGTGWDLVSIGDATENAAMRSHVTSATWIGLNDRATEGTFQWSNGDGVTYTNWVSDPDNGGSGGNEDCTDFVHASGYWDDKPCSDSRPSLCEGPINDPSAVVCPSGTVENSGECYAFSSTTAQWSNAESACLAYGSGWHLATIDSAAENTYIANNLTATSWIGYTDAAAEGSWVWSSGAGSGYTNWLTEPNGGTSANCVRLDGSTGGWTDESCASTYNSICEGGLGSGTPACATGETANATTGTCYYVETAAATDWATADATCAARGPGWHLTSITDAAEDTFVRGLLANGTYWIGLNDSATEGTAVWADSSVAWSGWHTVTNNANNRDCVKLDKATDSWTYNSCSPSGGLAYVCEGPKRRCFSGSVEYGGKCYAVDTTNRTWAQAQTNCKARGSGWDLVAVDNAAENAYVRSLTSSADNWIGLNDSAVEGTFVWSSGSTSSYRNWTALAPTGGTAQNCATIIHDVGVWDNAGWDDQSCTGSYAYACEGPKVAPPACNAGTTQSGTHCFALNASNQTWSAARTACQARGTGWDLATITSSTDNTFVQGATTTDTWIGLNDVAVEGTFVWADGSSSSYRHWASIEPNGGANADCVSLGVVSGAPTDGQWSDESCNTNHPALCEGPRVAAGAVTHTWSQTCVDAVASACNVKCGTPATGTGVCAAWLPGETNAACNQADLGVGVPCGNQIVPVCNHGTQTAPAGITVVHFAANSQQYPSTTPDLNSAARKDHGECVTTEPILPGRCIDVPCPSLSQNNEIMVNPPGLAGSIPECDLQDNWSLYNQGATCDAPTCSGASSRANLKKVNLYIIFDRSGSMGDALVGGGTKWSGSVSAMTAFFQDPTSAGLGIALEFFPLTANQTVNGVSTGDGCYSGNSCSSTLCKNPMVPLGTLTAAAAPTDTQEDTLVKALSGLSPSGNTPSYPAMRGALDWAIANHQADPTNEYAVVLVTDGDPTVCFSGASDTTTNAQIATDAASAYSMYGIHTYTISQEGANITALNAIASSGGTSATFVIGGNNQTQVRTDLLNALHTIAGTSASCSFDLPNQGSFDPKNAKVTYTSGSGTVLDLAHQPDATGCGSGWYYDNNTNPTKVTFCPSTCGIVQADTGAKIDVALGCPVPVKPLVYSQTYTGTCPPGHGTQWGYLSYDGITPGDSTLLFQVRAATTQAGLASASWVTVAQTPADPAVCGPGGPAPCPKALFPALGQYAAHFPYLELQITLNPTSDAQYGPTVNSWNLSYSCPYSE